jgi:putative flippase GtrA
LSFQLTELSRYGINGIVATLIHFFVLVFNLQFLEMNSAGLASMLAAIVGITISFLGSRYFVFKNTGERIASQFMKFSGVYGAIALLHGAVLAVWTDWNGLDFRIGFMTATVLQVTLSYLGNKFLVFRA